MEHMWHEDTQCNMQILLGIDTIQLDMAYKTPAQCCPDMSLDYTMCKYATLRLQCIFLSHIASTIAELYMDSLLLQDNLYTHLHLFFSCLAHKHHNDPSQCQKL
jgi:hypothetical protein